MYVDCCGHSFRKRLKRYGSLLDVKVHMMVFYTEVPSSCPQKLWSMLALSKSVPYFFMNSQVDECNFFFTIFFPNLAGLKLARLNIVLVS